MLFFLSNDRVGVCYKLWLQPDYQLRSWLWAPGPCGYHWFVGERLSTNGQRWDLCPAFVITDVAILFFWNLSCGKCVSVEARQLWKQHYHPKQTSGVVSLGSEFGISFLASSLVSSPFCYSLGDFIALKIFSAWEDFILLSVFRMFLALR